MDTQVVIIRFATEAGSPSLTDCLEQILRNLNPTAEETAQE